MRNEIWEEVPLTYFFFYEIMLFNADINIGIGCTIDSKVLLWFCWKYYAHHRIHASIRMSDFTAVIKIHVSLGGTCENFRTFNIKLLDTVFLHYVATSCAWASGVAVPDITGCIVVG